MRTDAQILIVERREKREMRNVNAHACSPQRFGQSFSTIFFTVDTFSWHVLCACVFCFCRFYHRPNKSWESKTTTKYIVSELFGLLNTAGWCNCWIFRWPKKTKLNQQAKAMCASLQQTTIQYTRFVCMCVCVCGINLSKFVSVHWFRFTANNFWFCHLHSKWREMCSVLSLLFLFFCCVVFFILCSSDEWDSIK